MEAREYDLVVIGSGPAGEKGAAQAAYFGKKVALIEKENVLGAAAANTGTLPSKTLRESALYLSGYRQRGLHGVSFSVNEGLTARDLLSYKTELAHILPFGIYTIPECSMAGETEEGLKEKGLAYVAGRARYDANGRGQIIGDNDGFIKLLFDVTEVYKYATYDALGKRAAAAA